MSSKVTFDGNAKWYTAVLVIFLSTPLIGLTLPHSGLADRQNRPLSPGPDWSALLSEPTRFFEETSDWSSDRMFFSVSAPKAYRKVKYYVFGDSSSDQLSRNGSLVFYNGPIPGQFSSIDDICRRPASWANETENLISHWVRIQDWGSRNNIEVYGLVVPSKPIVYADELPKNIPVETRDNCRLATAGSYPMTAFSAKFPESVVYPLVAFYDRKDEPSFYPEQNFHSDGFSAELAVRHLVSIASDFSYRAPDMVLQPGRADLAGVFGFDRQISIGRPAGDGGYLRDTSAALEIAVLLDIPNNQVNVFLNDEAVDESVVLVLANSFGARLSPFFARHFQKVVVINTNKLALDSYGMLYGQIISDLGVDKALFLMHEAGYYNRMRQHALGLNSVSSGAQGNQMNIDDILHSGWHTSRIEKLHRWSVGGATAKILIPSKGSGVLPDIRFKLKLFNVMNVASEASVLVCGRERPQLSALLSSGSKEVDISVRDLAGLCTGDFVLEIKTKRVASPSDLGFNEDERSLGVSITGFTITNNP